MRPRRARGRESRDYLDVAKAAPEADSAIAVAARIHSNFEESEDLEESEGSAALEISTDGRVLYHAHVTIGDDEYLVSMVPLRLDEDRPEKD